MKVKKITKIIKENKSNNTNNNSEFIKDNECFYNETDGRWILR